MLNFLCLAKPRGLFGIFTNGVDVLVADETRSIAALREVFPHENLKNNLIAWNIMSRAIADNANRYTLRHAPASEWRALVDTFSASTLGAKVQCTQLLTSKRVKPGANPIPVCPAMIEDVHNIRANGYDIEDEVVCLIFLRALPDEYNVFPQMLERDKERRAIDRMRTELRSRHDLSKGWKSSKSSNTAFLASGTKGEIADAAGKKCGNDSETKKKDGGL